MIAYRLCESANPDWPSLYDPAQTDAVILRDDTSLGMRRTEVLCASCHSHLGHVFEGEGATASTPSPSG